jgi:hypothetical protein
MLTVNAAETLTADTSSPGISTFFLGSPVPVTVTFTISGGPASTKESFSATVTNENGTTISTLPVSITTNSSGSGTATVTAPSSALGYYQVNATLADGSGTTISGLATRPAGFITYAVVPDPTTRVDYGASQSRFGMQGGFSSAQGPVIPYLGIRWVLSSAGGWYNLEGSYSGEFLANRNAALAKGQPYPAKNPVTDEVTYKGAAWNTYSLALISQASIPPWAGPLAGTTGTNNPNFGALNSAGMTGLPGFASAYAAEVAADYSTASVHYYQVTWEPETPWDYGGTPAELVQYFQLVYSEIHAADPKALVAGPTLFPNDEDNSQMAGLWAAGLGTCLDVQSVHPYGAGFPVESSDYITDIRTQEAQAKAAVGHSIPFIGTEHGLSSGSITVLQQAQGDIRQTLILLGEGFKFDFMFYIADFWNTSPSDTGNLYGVYYNLDPTDEFGTDKMGPKPAAPAFAAMTYLLDGSTTIGPMSGLTGTQMGYQFQLNNGTTMFAMWDWQASSSAATVTVPAGSVVNIYSMMGNLTSTVTSTGSVNLTLTGSPIYVAILPALTGAVSRQVHGVAGPFDLHLALTGTPTEECRWGSTKGNYSLILTFSEPVTSLTATLGLQAGQSGAVVGTAQTPVIVNGTNGSTVTVDLTGVGDAQRLNLQLSSIQPGNGTASVPINILWGDANGVGVVNGGDYLATRSKLNSTLNSTNFQYDAGCFGFVSGGDALLVRSLLNTYLP